MTPIDTVLGRLPDAKQTAPGRWRTACPACGGRSQSTLSVGEGDTGAVLLKCFKSGCDPHTIATALGLDIADLFPQRPDSAPLKRRQRYWKPQTVVSNTRFIRAARSVAIPR